MELRLTIFFALTFVVLAWNAGVLWLLFRMLRRAVGRLDQDQLWYRHLGGTLRMSVRAAEESTTRLAALSGEVRATVDQLGETLGRADNWARYGLAKLDSDADRASERLEKRTRQVGGRVGKQLYRTAVVIHGLKTALGFIARWKAGRHPIRTLPVPTPVDTALILLQAVTAVGELFSGPEPDE